MKTICIYHNDCLDGAAAAAVVARKYPGTKLCPTDHGEGPPPNLEGTRVFIVDFSFSAEILKKIKEEAAELHWYDHHKTAIPTRDEVGFGMVDLDESGATLTWKQLFPDKPLPRALLYVRDKDLWKWELRDSREINAELCDTDGILEPSHSNWDYLLKEISPEAWEIMVEHGARSRRLLRRRLEKAARRGFEIELDGHRCLAVNWTEDSSDMGEYIYKDLGYPVALIFQYSGHDWSFSLRSNKVDVSEIAIRRGGGGHPGASGFRTQSVEWLLKGLSS